MRVHPFLMFEGAAAEAMKLYVSLFEDGAVLDEKRYPDGKVMVASFRVAGQTVMCSDSPVHHEFGFTPAVSLFVDCTSAEEQEKLAAALGAKVLMPLDNYGFSRRFTWVNDRFGVSWQLNLA